MIKDHSQTSSSRSFQLEQKLEGSCLIIAPLFLMASTFFWRGSEYGAEAATFIIFSMFFWIPAFMGLFSLVKNELAHYAVWGLWIAVLGCISGVCFAFLGYLSTVMNISHQQYINSLSIYPVTSQLLLFASGPLFPLSVLVLGIVLTLKKSVALWTGVLFSLGAIVFPLSRIQRIEWIAHVADLLLFIPSVAIGLQLVSNSKQTHP